MKLTKIYCWIVNRAVDTWKKGWKDEKIPYKYEKSFYTYMGSMKGMKECLPFAVNTFV